MNQYEEKIKNYLKDNKIIAEHLVFKQSCHSVAEAALAVNASSDEFVKNICMFDSQDNLIVAIVKGEDKVSLDKISKLNSSEKLKMAKPQEILEKTGYPCGGTPSFGYKAKFMIDTKVMEKEFVYSGGGSENSLIKISTKELKKANNGVVEDIKK